MQKEMYGTRDLSFSAWHRRDSIKRFIDYKDAEKLSMIDLDSACFIEWEDNFKEPIAIIEAAIDHGQYKHARIIQRLAEKADIYGLLLLYKLSNERNPVDKTVFDIMRFKVKVLYPKESDGFAIFTPKQWAESLVEMRKYALSQIHNQIANHEKTNFSASKEKDLKSETTANRQYGTGLV
jgi:hypothetical protein